MKKRGSRKPAALSHVDAAGQAKMVDVSAKRPTMRRAVAESFVRLSRDTLACIAEGLLPKGNAVETARIAGILAAKRTAELIPMCHPLPLTNVEVRAEVCAGGIRFEAGAACIGPTGVEMEALTAAAVAALTLYDMVKAVEKRATIERIRLLEKSGGKSDFRQSKNY